MDENAQSSTDPSLSEALDYLDNLWKANPNLPYPVLMGAVSKPQVVSLFDLSLEQMLVLGLVELTEAGKAYRDHRITQLEMELGLTPSREDRAGVTA